MKEKDTEFKIKLIQAQTKTFRSMFGQYIPPSLWDDVDFLISELSTALSLSSAYREALKEIRGVEYGPGYDIACNALDRGPEEKVGRDEGHL